MNAINELNQAMAFLCENHCKRISGIWMTSDGRALRSDPVESSRLLRRERLIREIAERKESGRCFTR